MTLVSGSASERLQGEERREDRQGGPVAAAAVRRVTSLKICLVAHLAYGALSRTSGHIGGVEHQTTQLARWLASRGHRVTMVTWDEGQLDGTVIDDVVVRTVCRREAGWPGVRFIHPRWSSLVGALRRADAEVYYHNSAEYVTGQIAIWCRMHARKFVYASASNADCDRQLPFLTTSRERILYRLGLRHAAARIVQTAEQQRMMLDSFGLPSVVIPMPGSDMSVITAAATPPDTQDGAVLWIGRLCAIKRPDRLLAIAAACPQLRFELIGPVDGSPYSEDIVRQARRLPNLRVRGGCSRDEVAEALARALCLCCTSEIEGFPNTFLEAWSHSVPVISTIDPDGVIDRHRLGWCVHDVQAMVERLSTLAADPASRQIAAANARRYYLAAHTPAAVMPRVEALLMKVAGAAA